jgi:hypothetical protein
LVLDESRFSWVAFAMWAADLELEGIEEGLGQVVLATFEHEVLRWMWKGH